MPGFFDIKSDKWPVWGLFASVLVVFVGFTLVFKDFVSSKTTTRQLALKCDNPDCTYTEILSPDEKMLMAKANYEALQAEDLETAEQYLDEIYEREIEFEDNPTEDSFTDGQLEDMLLMSWGTNDGPAFTCPKCEQKTVWDALACQNPNGCDNIFFRESFSSLYPDRCTKCEYSRREARQQEARDEKQRLDQIKKEIKEQR